MAGPSIPTNTTDSITAPVSSTIGTPSEISASSNHTMDTTSDQGVQESSATSMSSESDASSSTASVSSSAEDDSSADEIEEDRDQTTPEPQDIRARLAAFLPRIKAANEALKADQNKSHDIEDVGEAEPHIEMSLGLGVLEEKNGDFDGSSSSGSESESEEDGEDGGNSGKQEDVLENLMGRGGEVKKAGIEDLG